MNYRIATASLALTLLLGAAPAVHAQRATEPITLNFVNADIEAVARTMAAITGRNIVVVLRDAAALPGRADDLPR
jgi:general secretion pathway protein D